MIRVYNDSDLWNAMAQKRKLLGIFYGVTAGVFAVFLAFMIYFIMLPYNDPNKTWVIVVCCVLVGLYLMFVFPFMGISYKRCRAYCKMLRFISLGLKESVELPFLEIDDWTTRDGVDVNVAVFLIKNIKRDEEMKRQIYVDGEKDFPPFEEGDVVKMVLQGNLLIGYEIQKTEAEA